MKIIKLSNNADTVAAISYVGLVEQALPEQRRVVLDRCASCGAKCEKLCEAGERIAWGLAEIRVNVEMKFN